VTDSAGVIGNLEPHFEKGEAGFVELVVRCRMDFAQTEPLLFLGEFAYPDLAKAATADSVGRPCLPEDFFADPRRRLFLASGWQSWSFAGELTWKERPRRAVMLKELNRFVDHPAEAELRARAKERRGRPDIVSHFFVVLRQKETRLGLVSTAWGSGEKRPGPPLTFLLGPASLRIFAYAEGASFEDGEVLARVALVPAADYFSLKDGFARIAACDPGRFEALSGICDLGSLRPKIVGFETWYNRYLDIDAKTVMADLEAVASAPGDESAPADAGPVPIPRRAPGRALGLPLGGAGLRLQGEEKPAVFQIDDGWERRVGDWRPDPAKFPDGMAGLAGAISARGFVSGLWLAPFLVMPGAPLEVEHPEWILSDEAGLAVSAGWNPGWGGKVHCLDLSLPEVEDYLVGLMETVVRDWGFSFLKLDFLYAGMLRGRRRGRAGGAWEHYVRVLRRIAGIPTRSDSPGATTRPAAILSCGAPFETTAPILPLMRVGADTREVWDWTALRLLGHQGRPSAKVNISHSLARSLLDRTFLLSDPDVFFSRTQNLKLGDAQKFLAGIVAWAFASQLMTSDAPSGAPSVTPDGAHAGASRDAHGVVPSRGSASSLSQADFLANLASLWRRLGDREFAVERFDLSSQDLYCFRSRDGKIHGAINLSSRTEVLALESPGGEPKPAVLPPRTIVLFGLESSTD